ncbi:MAG: tail fiber domain-containing protein [Phycisphaeraceae bacterium]|nr:tail fiber domain-containing protein [Phycisphaeraceae bacterium]
MSSSAAARPAPARAGRRVLRPSLFTWWVRCGVAAAILHTSTASASDPSHDAFTYQGQLRHDGDPVTGPVGLTFRLFDAASGGVQVGPDVSAPGFSAFDDDGRFTIDLAFGKGVFDGAALWLEIQVDDTVLSPRQPIMPAPYAVRALNVAVVSNAALAGTYSGALNFTNPGNTFVGSGAGLTSLHAGSLTTGTVGIERMPPGGSWSLASNLGITGGNVGIGAGSPTITLAIGDNGTGFHRPATDVLALHSAGTERVRVTSNGDVGIGQDSIPTANLDRRRLHVKGHGGTNVNGIRLTHGTSGVNWDLLIGGSANSFPGGLAIAHEGSATTGLVLRDNGHLGVGTAAPPHRLTVQTSPGAFGIQHTDGVRDVTTFVSATGGWIGTRADTPLHLYAADSPARMTITQSGNIGIGTAAPDYPLTVSGSAKISGNVAIGNAIPFHPLTVVGNATVSGNFGIGALIPQRRLHIIGEGGSQVNGIRVMHGSEGSNWDLVVGGDATGFPGGLAIAREGSFTTGIVLSAAGNAGVGLTNPSFRLDLPNIAGPTGQGRANAWTTYSSVRWKENIVSIDDALGKFLALRGVAFDWKAGNGGGRDIGFIAEEVGAVVPELVDWEEDGVHAKSLKYDRVAAIAVEALRELRAEKDADIASLRAEKDAQIDALLARVAALEATLERVLAGARRGPM